MEGVPEQFNDEKDSARFRHLAQVPGLELYHAHISRYAFEPHTHEAFGIGVIEAGPNAFVIVVPSTLRPPTLSSP